MLREEAYVPFDIDFSERDGTAKVITGPNMAGELQRFPRGSLADAKGKSSCVRATVRMNHARRDRLTVDSHRLHGSDRLVRTGVICHTGPTRRCANVGALSQHR